MMPELRPEVAVAAKASFRAVSDAGSSIARNRRGVNAVQILLFL